ncbi:hypothetical protein A6E01_20535 (plasmid) [Vibrio breoganii]|uniref:Uncharacterized protein n=1 Tax=Vibrio breoganii TaxID=553239 RepID=A0AAN1CUK5_9VIBR|nr:hypothetical protein [Vibrio breoganii]ANO35602.1 hypothetical protein A6E01_20535 [Vibrio breoganii]PML15861.1 hypothetical protein BCT84_07615 [Vibrio breoganii]
MKIYNEFIVLDGEECPSDTDITSTLMQLLDDTSIANGICIIQSIDELCSLELRSLGVTPQAYSSQNTFETIIVKNKRFNIETDNKLCLVKKTPLDTPIKVSVMFMGTV